MVQIKSTRDSSVLNSKHALMNITVQPSSNRKALPDTEKLTFGSVFTDHMFIVDCHGERGWNNPRIVPYGPFQMDPACSALHYGQSMFEGMKAYRQTSGRVILFRPDFHIQRLNKGAARLSMQGPPAELFLNGLKKLLEVDRDWVPRDAASALYIRPTLFASEAFLGVRPAQNLTFFIILSPVSTYYKAGTERLKIWVERNFVRAAPGGLGEVKASANYVASLAAAQDAKKRGFAQVLWTSAITHEYVEEVGTMNVFFRFKDAIVTPSLDGTILNGCTRDTVLHLLREWKQPVQERKLRWQEVLDRNNNGELLEAFGTGTAASISRIGELGFDGGQIVLPAETPLADRLKAELHGIHYGQIKRPDWVMEV